VSHAKQAPKRRGRRKAVTALGVAGMLSLAGGASGAAVGPTGDTPTENSTPVITLGEEEISDVSLATFYVFDKENAGAPPPAQHLRLARGGGCGCGHGGGGCGCGGVHVGCSGCGRGCHIGHRACRCGGFRGCVGCVGCAGWGGCDYNYPIDAFGDIDNPTPETGGFVSAPPPAPTCHRSEETVTVPSETGGTRQIKIINCP
jgi:hypothetical protein